MEGIDKHTPRCYRVSCQIADSVSVSCMRIWTLLQLLNQAFAVASGKGGPVSQEVVIDA